MRYWLYSDGNILGPYTPAELSEVPDFSEESLVCEAKEGEVSDNWKPASQIKELAKYLYPEASEAAEPERKEDPVSKIFEDFRVSSHENGEKAPEAASAGTADVEASRKASAQTNAEEAVQPEQAQIIEEIPVQPSSGRQEPDDEFEKLFKKETENRKRKEVKKSIADILNEPDGGILAREKKNGGEDEIRTA